VIVLPNGTMTRVVEDHCELGMTMGASETRFVRCHAFSTRRLKLPFAREVNPLAICSGPALLLWPRQLPCQDKHAFCGPVGGPERLPRRLVGITIEDRPLLSTGNMAFLANAWSRCAGTEGRSRRRALPTLSMRAMQDTSGEVPLA